MARLLRRKKILHRNAKLEHAVRPEIHFVPRIDSFVPEYA
jgi:hypothetical protein